MHLLKTEREQNPMPVSTFAESLQHRVEVFPYMEDTSPCLNIYVWK